MGALKNATIDRDDVIIPWPVRDYSPPIEEIDDAPPAEALSFREWMAHVAHTFRILGDDRGHFMASLIATRIKLCKEHGIDDPYGLIAHDAAEAERIAEDYARLLGRVERAEAELARRDTKKEIQP